jgi:hypothetical protein
MRQDYEKLFAEIMLRIKRGQRILAIRRLFIFSLTAIFSAVIFVFAFNILGVKISESGFLQFFSLIFSDFKTVITYWESFALSLLESLPIISLTIVLATIFAFLESLKFLARDIKILWI